MKIIAKKGGPEFYNGTLGKTIVEDLRKRGSIITFEDFNNYRTKWTNPLTTNLTDGVKLFTSNLPSSGALLAFVLNIFDEFKFNVDSLKGWNNTITTYHRIIETWKYAYAVRSKMGDADYVDMTNVIIIIKLFYLFIILLKKKKNKKLFYLLLLMVVFTADEKFNIKGICKVN